jgi:hypothetical protein
MPRSFWGDDLLKCAPERFAAFIRLYLAGGLNEALRLRWIIGL